MGGLRSQTSPPCLLASTPRRPSKALVFGLKFQADLRKQRMYERDRKSTRLNSSHANISYAVFCLKKKKPESQTQNPTNIRGAHGRVDQKDQRQCEQQPPTDRRTQRLARSQATCGSRWADHTLYHL